jgi:hypothetical protein
MFISLYYNEIKVILNYKVTDGQSNCGKEAFSDKIHNARHNFSEHNEYANGPSCTCRLVWEEGPVL